MKPAEARAFFPALERYVWLTHGGGSPPSLRVREAVERAAARPFESEDPWGWAQEYYEDRNALLAGLGRMVGATADDITLTRGTAQGLSLVRGLDWGPGDSIVSAELEFPANLYPWLALQTRGVELRLVKPEDGRVTPEGVFAIMDDRTKAVALRSPPTATATCGCCASGAGRSNATRTTLSRFSPRCSRVPNSRRSSCGA